MAKLIKRAQVAFNLEDPYQAKMYAHVSSQTNSSGYLKRLIQRDFDGLGANQVRYYESVGDEADNRIDADLVSGLI